MTWFLEDKSRWITNLAMSIAALEVIILCFLPEALYPMRTMKVKFIERPSKTFSRDICSVRPFFTKDIKPFVRHVWQTPSWLSLTKKNPFVRIFQYIGHTERDYIDSCFLLFTYKIHKKFFYAYCDDQFVLMYTNIHQL